MPPSSPASSTESPGTQASTTAALAVFIAPAATTPQPTLCVSVQRMQTSFVRGHAGVWQIGAWTLNGNASGVVIRLATTPSSQNATFSFGCGGQDGSTSCNLGTVTSGSAARQVLAKVTVPATATAVSSVKLTASLTAAHLVTEPTVSAAVSVTAPAASSSPATSSPTTPTSSPASPASSNAGGRGSGAGGTGAGAGTGNGSVTSPLPLGSLPTIGSAGSTSLSPGGNASGLFPTVNPSGVPNPSPNPGQGSSNEVAKRVANSNAMPIGTPVIDAQLAGLAALGVAFMLTVTRLSIRRRPSAAAKSAAAAKLAAATGPAEAAKATETAKAVLIEKPAPAEKPVSAE